MKKYLKYIGNIWCGDDGKLSIKRVLATLFSVDLCNNFHKAGDVIYEFVVLYKSGKILDPLIVASLGSFLSSEIVIMGIEAGLITAFLSLTTYQSLKLNQQSVESNNGPIIDKGTSGSS